MVIVLESNALRKKTLVLNGNLWALFGVCLGSAQDVSSSQKHMNVHLLRYKTLGENCEKEGKRLKSAWSSNYNISAVVYYKICSVGSIIL
jgi:hypothetical protein